MVVHVVSCNHSRKRMPVRLLVSAYLGEERLGGSEGVAGPHAEAHRMGEGPHVAGEPHRASHVGVDG